MATHISVASGGPSSKGKAEGEVIALRGVIIDLLDLHSPRLRELALQAVGRAHTGAELRSLYKKIILAADETAIHQVLSGFPDRS